MHFSKWMAALFVGSLCGCIAPDGDTSEPWEQGSLSLEAESMEGQGSYATVDSVSLARVGEDFQLSWTTSGDINQIRVYAGTDPDDLDTLATTTTSGSTVTIEGLDPDLRHYFRVKGGSGPGLVAGERGLPQAGVSNLRDLGGYDIVGENKDRHVAWGQLYRSAFIQPSANQTFLATLGIHTVIDVRNPFEIAAAGPQNVPGTTFIYKPVYDQNAVGFDPVTPHLCFPGNQTQACYDAQEAYFGPNGETMRALKNGGLRALVSGNGGFGFNFGQTTLDATRALLETLADENNLPLVWADSGGDARAGWGSAVVLMLLGVPEEQVVLDYTLTTQFRQPVITAQLNALVGSGLLAKAVYLEPQLIAYPEYMEGAIDEMHTVYGSVEDYAHALGVTDDQIESIRENLTRH